MSKKENSGSPKWIFLAGLAAFVGMAAFLLVSGSEKREAALTAVENQPTVQQIPNTGASALVETNPVLPDTLYTGRAAKTYKIAAQIPGVIDGLYCYCKCKENPMFKHKTLLTCFTNNHAADCDICMHEAEMAWDLTKEGKTPKEVRAAVDEYYAKHQNL